MIILCLWSVVLQAQVNLRIDAGAHMVNSAYNEVVMDSGIVVNNGNYWDSSGIFRGRGGIMFSGGGTTDMLYLKFDNAQFSKISSPVSVFHTATIGPSAEVDANSKLHIRSDRNTTANLVVFGKLWNGVLGLVARATVTSSCNPFTSDLTLNVSGSSMKYQWQSSPDSLSWSNIIGALSATYTASVSATTYYRCALSTINTTFNQNTPGVKLTMDFSEITGDSVTCVGSSIALANSTAGGSWTSGSPSVATVGAASGIVTGVSNGVANITYILPSGCFRVKRVTVGLPAITGTTNVCIGTTTALSHPVAGGTWTSSAPYYATVNATTGVVTGVHTGSTMITYTAPSGCYVTTSVNVVNTTLNITGGLSSCPGQTTTLVCPGFPGGTWTSADPSIVTINATSGVMTGVATGTAVVTYTYAYCFKTAVATVNAAPSAVTGTPVVCVANTTSMSCATSGGVWSSSVVSRATVDASGIVTGVAAGTSRISYTIPGGCASYQVVTVGAMPAAITGITAVCTGSATTLGCTPGGGTWSSSDVATATVSPISTSTASVSGVAVGVATISYNTATGCTRTTTVNVNPSPGPISGSLSVCVGSTSMMTAGTPGGTWSSAAPSIASVGAATGVVTGASAGTVVISYRTSSTCYALAQATVSAAGSISGASSLCVGATITLVPPTGGGTWTSGNTARATVDASTGVVTGVAQGVVNITYTISSSCFTVKSVTVYANPSAITGASSLCEGATVTLGSSAGGVWSVADPSVATMAGTVLTGISAGVTTVSYIFTSTGCFTTRSMTVNTMPTAISGGTAICVGDTVSYLSGPSGGTWTSSAPAVGSVDAVTGVVTGRAGGGTIIRYTLSSGCQVSKAITVNVLPAAITGTMLFCAGNTVTLASTTSGATWSIADASIASIAATTATTATLTGVNAGNTTLSYTNANGCYRTAALTVNAAVAPIVGADTVCGANSVMFSSATSGGTWMSNATTRATVGATTGQVNGITAGTALISYTVSAGCRVWKGVTVIAAVAAISGATNVCEGSSTTFTHTVSGGTWSSAAPSIAIVGGATGLITGVSAGTVNISYIISEGCYKTKPITIKMLPVITGVATLEVGETDTFTAVPTGGVWATGAASIASVNGYGVVGGVSIGTAIISYTSTGCVSTSPIEIMPASSLKPIRNEEVVLNVFKVFPNPNHGALSVTTNVDGSLMITSIDGRQVHFQALVAGTTDITLPASLAAGVYVCRFVATDGLEQSARLIFDPY